LAARGLRSAVLPRRDLRGTIRLRLAYYEGERRLELVKFLLFCILLVLCWPVAIVALLLYPIIWLLLLPFRIVGIAVGGVLDLIWALFSLPARLLR
jgi:hypothetical protein